MSGELSELSCCDAYHRKLSKSLAGSFVKNFAAHFGPDITSVRRSFHVKLRSSEIHCSEDAPFTSAWLFVPIPSGFRDLILKTLRRSNSAAKDLDHHLPKRDSPPARPNLDPISTSLGPDREGSQGKTRSTSVPNQVPRQEVLVELNTRIDCCFHLFLQKHREGTRDSSNLCPPHNVRSDIKSPLIYPYPQNTSDSDYGLSFASQKKAWTILV